MWRVLGGNARRRHPDSWPQRGPEPHPWSQPHPWPQPEPRPWLRWQTEAEFRTIRGTMVRTRRRAAKERGKEPERASGKARGDSGADVFFRPFEGLKAKLMEQAKREEALAAPEPVSSAAGRKQGAPQAKEPRAGGSTEPLPQPGVGAGGLQGDLSDEETRLFLEEMAGVRPLDQDARARVHVRKEAQPKPPRDDDAEGYAQLCDLVYGEGPFDIADTPEYIEGLAPGIDRRLLRRLRNGDYAVQAHVDLHGLTAVEAKERVQAFVRESRARGLRCVLIVHGRGLNSKDHIPVLKERLRQWLTRGSIGKNVLCFATARPYDGGAGAVYVLLRR